MLAQAFRTCAKHILFEAAAANHDLGKFRAHVIGRDGHCPNEFALDVRLALAKLGDRQAFLSVVSDLNLLKYNKRAVDDLGFIGDDQSIAALLDYFSKQNESDTHGLLVPTDDIGSTYDPLVEVAESLRRIEQRRELKGISAKRSQIVDDNRHEVVENGRTVVYVQFVSPAMGALLGWQNWWKEHSSTAFSRAYFLEITDPELRCLARDVEWGLPNAILKMASSHNPLVVSVLQKFDRGVGGEPMGTLPGNVQVALAKLGDERAFAGIVGELNENSEFTSVEKLKFVGGQKAVNVLVGALGTSASASPDAPNHENRSSSLSTDTKVRRNLEYQISILEALTRLVKNPPLTESEATPENIQKWKLWWARNKDQAQFVTTP